MTPRRAAVRRLTESQFNTHQDLTERAAEVLAMWTLLQSCKRVSVTLAEQVNAFLKPFKPGPFDSIDPVHIEDAYDAAEAVIRARAEEINDEARNAGLDESPITLKELVG